MRTEFNVEGFHCASCEMLVKDVAGDCPEITSCEVDIKTGKVVLEHKDWFDLAGFKQEIESVGNYTVRN